MTMTDFIGQSDKRPPAQQPAHGFEQCGEGDALVEVDRAGTGTIARGGNPAAGVLELDRPMDSGSDDILGLEPTPRLIAGIPVPHSECVHRCRRGSPNHLGFSGFCPV